MQSTKLTSTLVARPRLAHLIDLYERNFLLLERLLPELELPFDHAITVERSPYTVELRLTYEFREPAGIRLAPDFWIKVYRDARVAEALHCTQRPPWLAQEGGAPEAELYLNDQWSRNLMLSRWLEYLLHHGHGFAHIDRPRRAQPAPTALAQNE